MTEFLVEVYEKIGDHSATIDTIIDRINDMCWAGQFSEIDALLASFDVDRLDTFAAVAILSMTHCISDKLTNREVFRQKCYAKWPERDLFDKYAWRN